MLFHRSLKKRALFSLPVVFVTLLVFFVFYCYHAGYKWLGYSSLVSDVAVYFFVFMIEWSYFTSSFTDPGTVPLGYTGTEGEKAYEASKCKFCDVIMPPRAHHCRVCDRCVLRQDHHCPWIGNCVGFHNHRYFIQFLFYATLNTGIVGSSCLGHYLTNEDYNYFTLTGAFLGSGLSALIGGLGGFHVWGMLANKTTLETKRFRNQLLFDLGDWRKNLKQIFGENIFAVVLPIPTYGHLDGCEYPYIIENFIEEPREEKDEEL